MTPTDTIHLLLTIGTIATVLIPAAGLINSFRNARRF